MKITFLGTGTSMGVPMIGCQCATCTSEDPRDKRLRSSVWIQHKEQSIIIDTGIDFRQQALRAGITSLDAILFTHHHVDHIFGLDDVRPLDFFQGKPITIYATNNTLTHLRQVYPHIFGDGKSESDVARPRYIAIDENPFAVNGLPVQPVPLFHGSLPVLGFRIGSFAYCTDVSQIPERSYYLLKNLDILVLGALRYQPHPTHFTIDKAVETAKKISAKQTYLIHLSHKVRHAELSRKLPVNILPSFDGMELTLPDTI